MEQFICPQTSTELETRFATEAACRAYLMQLRWPNGFTCPRCGHRRGWPATRGRLICQGCHRQTSVTAGTVFQGTHKPLPLWFRAIWQVAGEDHVASSRDLQRILGVRYLTAWTWASKLRRATVRPERDRLSGHVEVDLTWVGATSGREPDNAFAVIAAEVDGSGTGRIRMSRTKYATQKSLRGFLTASIEPGSVVHGYGLVGKRDAIAAGCHYEQVFLGCDQNAAVDLLPRLRRIEALLHRWLSGTQQDAAHRDHLDAYLDEFTVRFNQRVTKSRGELFHQLLRESLTTSPIAVGGAN